MRKHPAAQASALGAEVESLREQLVTITGAVNWLVWQILALQGENPGEPPRKRQLGFVRE